jgi:hypothetical protein
MRLPHFEGKPDETPLLREVQGALLPYLAGILRHPSAEPLAINSHF